MASKVLPHGYATGAREHQRFSSALRRRGSKQVGQFVLDDFNGFKNLVLVSSTGDDHLSGTEDEANDLWVVKSINQSRELFWLVLHLVKRKVEGQVVQIQFARNASLWLTGELVHAVVIFGVMKGVGGDHVLHFNGDVLEVPGLDACSTR